MAIYIIRVPDIGEGIAEVELAAWHVAPGQPVQEDQPVADVMTDKATVEIPSPVSGKVLALGGAVGQMLAVGAELIRLEVEGAGNLPAASGVESAAEPASKPEPEPSSATQKEAVSALPAKVSELKASDNPANTAPAALKKEVLAAPAVRRRARDGGVDLRQVPGTGPAGQITHADLDAWLRGASEAARDGTHTIPVLGLRRQIAHKMQEAKRRIAHFSYVEEVDMTELEALRQQLNARHGATRGKLTLLPFVVRALVLALRQFPQINARYDDEAEVVTRFEAVHLGIATQTPGGLMVPVLHHAERLGLWDCAAGIARLAEGARTGKLGREALSGATITLTSLGALGGIASTPIVHHPQVAIVGVNRMVQRPMFQHGQVVARQLMNLSSSFDHRVVDGMDAAQCIQAVRTLLETPALLWVEGQASR